jgi:GNAT superfamily N-acetyltransferase
VSAGEPELVRADPALAGALSELARRSKGHWPYPAAWLEAWRAELTFTPQWIREHEVCAAMLEGEPVGVYALAGDGAVLELEHFWVCPRRMGRGVGRRLLEHAADRARARGAEAIEIDSDPYAEAFYRRLGARAVGRTPAPMPGAPDRFLPRLRLELD